MICRAFQPEGGALVVTWNTDALGEADRIVECADQVALLGRPLEPFMHGWRLMCEAGYAARLQQRREIRLGAGIAGLRGTLEPGGRLVRIAGHARPSKVEHAESPCGGFVSALRRGSEPVRRLDIVRWQSATAGIDVAQNRGRLAFARESSAAQPAFAVERVNWSTAAFEQHQTEPHLRGAELSVRRKFVVPSRLCLIQRCANSTLSSYAEQVVRGG